MTLCDLNCYVNLPRLVNERLKLKGYSFLKLPHHGWVAYDAEKRCYALQDLYKGHKLLELYRFVTREDPSYLDV